MQNRMPLRTGLLAVATIACYFPQLVVAQYKCVQSGGAISFQQQPCPNGQQSQKLTIKAAPPSEETDHPANIRKAVAARRPAVGMTNKELERAMGAPDKVNAAQYGAKRNDQLIFYRGNRTIYVYTENGLVTSIQDTEGGRLNTPSPAGAVGKRCPTSHEIRDLEIEMNKLQNRSNARLQAELRREYSEAKNCGR